MKVPSFLVIAISAAALLSPSAFAEQPVQQLLNEAQKSYMRGDIETAKQQFLTVNRMDPKNPTAIGFLRRIQAESQKNTGASLEKQYAAVIIPKVEFKDATVGSALNYLKQVLSNTTEGKTTVNFIVQLPEEQVNKQTVSLNVSNMPFTEVLRYFGGLADVQIEYDKYAVVVKPKGATTAAAVTGAAAPAGAAQ